MQNKKNNKKERHLINKQRQSSQKGLNTNILY
jgi:hypothetical protein